MAVSALSIVKHLNVVEDIRAASITGYIATRNTIKTATIS
jgi:hypothetical protein